MINYTVQVTKDATCWLLNGKLHRVGGPAIEWADGTKCWYWHGQFHREDGPAIERADGTKYWYRHGQRIEPPQPEVVIDGVAYTLVRKIN